MRRLETPPAAKTIVPLVRRRMVVFVSASSNRNEIHKSLIARSMGIG
jgi:hypothetical protein